MMNHYAGFGHMYNGGSGFLCTLIGIVIFIDLILVGMWIWKKIKKEEECCHPHDHGEHHHHGHHHDHVHEEPKA